MYTYVKVKQVSTKKRTVGIAVIKTTKTRVVVMVTSSRRHSHIDFMKSSRNVDVGTSPRISYHYYYPCFGDFYYCDP